MEVVGYKALAMEDTAAGSVGAVRRLILPHYPLLGIYIGGNCYTATYTSLCSSSSYCSLSQDTSMPLTPIPSGNGEQ